MKVVHTIKEVREFVNKAKLEGKTVGLVPTMGFLHQGHASLIKKAVEQNDVVVVSDFVNPTQFGPNEDLEAYPKDIKADAKLCENIGADLIFNPEPSEMYHSPKAYVNINDMANNLCGAKRPVHFGGVCTVVSKLFNIVNPDRAYFGQKDAQQLCIITKMVEDLNFPVEIVPCPIVREQGGLALSSRNTYLSEEEHQAARCLSKSLQAGRIVIKKDVDAETVIEAIKEVLDAEKLATIDYIEIVGLDDLQKVETINKDVLVAIAVYIGKTRLIDNFIFHI